MRNTYSRHRSAEADVVPTDDATELSRILDRAVSGGLITDPSITLRYCSDWTGRWTLPPHLLRGVVRPRTSDEVATVLKLCNSTGTPVFTQGGNTGLVGGAVPTAGGVVLSTENLREVGPINDDGHVTVGAGVTLDELEVAARSGGYTAGLTLASSGSATMGGIAATNAGGARVLRYGPARARIAGLRAVTAAGEFIDRADRLVKDNTGYELTELLIGSEGTLAVITDVTWRLVRPNTSRVSLVFRLADVGSAVEAATKVAAHVAVEAIEWARGHDVALVGAHLGKKPPLPTDGYWIFVDLGDSHLAAARESTASPSRLHEALVATAEAVVEELVSSGLVTLDDVLLAETSADRSAHWAFRESMTEAIASHGVALKFDVAVPLPAFAQFQLGLEQSIADSAAQARLVTFGHLAEGNLHINLLPPEGHPRIGDRAAEDLEALTLNAVLAAGGTVSAEHGIGRAKVHWLAQQRGRTQVDLMRQVKAAWDPSGTLNPGVLF